MSELADRIRSLRRGGNTTDEIAATLNITNDQVVSREFDPSLSDPGPPVAVGASTEAAVVSFASYTAGEPGFVREVHLEDSELNDPDFLAFDLKVYHGLWAAEMAGPRRGDLILPGPGLYQINANFTVDSSLYGKPMLVELVATDGVTSSEGFDQLWGGTPEAVDSGVSAVIKANVFTDFALEHPKWLRVRVTAGVTDDLGSAYIGVTFTILRVIPA